MSEFYVIYYLVVLVIKKINKYKDAVDVPYINPLLSLKLSGANNWFMGKERPRANEYNYFGFFKTKRYNCHLSFISIPVRKIFHFEYCIILLQRRISHA